MPGFVRSKKDEAKWSKAKKHVAESKAKDEESFSDRDWALVNHIYHQINKSSDPALSNVSDIETIIRSLQETKKLIKQRYNDDEDPYNLDPSEEDLEGFSIIDPEKEGQEGSDEDYQEYSPEEDEDEHIRSIDPEYQPDLMEEMGLAPSEQRSSEEETAPEESELSYAQAAKAPSKTQPKEPKVSEKTPSQVQPSETKTRSQEMVEPTMEELNALRMHTRPWEQRARDLIKLKADPKKNPFLARDGHIVEARNLAHKNRQSAYNELINSDNYKNADPISQMEMDEKFERDWKTNNPTHTAQAVQAHITAHEKGQKNKELFDAHKEAQIRNIIEGGATPEQTYSAEEAMQHAGGAKGEEGTIGSIVSDPHSSFAMGNQEFIKDYAKNYSQKAKKVSNLEDMENYSGEDKKDVERILGSSAKSPMFDAFFNRYNKLIPINAKKAISALGLSESHPNVDMGLLHEAGMHGLIQAINTYDPDKGASFKTHASRTINGLQMTALKSMDQVPADVRRAAKLFHKKQAASAQPKAEASIAQVTPTSPAQTPAPVQAPKPSVAPHEVISASPHPSAPDMSDRLKRIDAQKKVILRRAGSRSE